MNKAITGVIAVLVIIAGIWFWGQDSEVPESGSPAADQNNQANQTTDDTAGDTIGAPAVKEFTVTGSNFKFSTSEIRVKKGDTVHLTLMNQEGMHNWKIDAFNTGTKVLQAGAQETIEFTADKAGTFEYYCSVGTHRQMGMRGNLIVEE